MDTGLLHNNTAYYDGFEGEDEVIFELQSDAFYNIHLWTGYIDDILRDPDLSGKGWIGLTRDYHQLEGAFADHTESVFISPQEYLLDLQQYQGKHFEYPESTDVLHLLMQFFKYAVDMGSKVVMKVA